MDEGLFLDCMSRKNHIITIITSIFYCHKNLRKTCKFGASYFLYRGHTALKVISLDPPGHMLSKNVWFTDVSFNRTQVISHPKVEFLCDGRLYCRPTHFY